MSCRLISRSYPTAAREHRCELCTRTIARGEGHTKEVSVSDGAFQSIRLHTLCEDMIATYFAGQYAYDEFTYDDLYTELIEQEKSPS